MLTGLLPLPLLLRPLELLQTLHDGAIRYALLVLDGGDAVLEAANILPPTRLAIFVLRRVDGQPHPTLDIQIVPVPPSRVVSLLRLNDCSTGRNQI